ncbi:MAG: aminopeptidase P N-terminal domain-containing protein [Candidatus Microsaccharimonas sp.]
MHYERLSRDRIYILAAHSEMQKSVDTAYTFHQDPHFFWLTGLQEPGWLVILNTYTGEKALLAPERDVTKTLFDGSLSDEEVQRVTGIATIIEGSDQSAYIEKLSEQYDTVYMLGKHPHQKYFQHVENPGARDARRRMKPYFAKVIDCRQEFDALRAIKSSEEIDTMRRAIAASIEGFARLKDTLTAATYEYQLEAALNYAFRSTGAGGHAYDPIVASGKNACTLHYVKNNHKLPMNGLVLVDAGATIDGYCADITRTYAVGTPTKRQVAVHAEVEKAHHRIIALIQPGVSFKSYQNDVDEIMKTALENLGLLKDRNDTEVYRKYFPHAISHGLGIDVHESLGGFGEFKPGMVLTVEPGIYIPEEGIGVRIEDDILVTNNGSENLSKDLPTSL